MYMYVHAYCFFLMHASLRAHYNIISLLLSSVVTEEHVVRDDDVTLLEVVLSKDAHDCSIHSSCKCCHWSMCHVLVQYIYLHSCSRYRKLTNDVFLFCTGKTDSDSSDGTILYQINDNRNSSSSSGASQTSKTLMNTPTKSSSVPPPHTDHSRPHQAHVAAASSDAASHDINDVRVTPAIRQMDDTLLRAELRQRGDRPGPVTPQTRRVYETRLARLMADPQLANRKHDHGRATCDMRTFRFVFKTNLRVYILH